MHPQRVLIELHGESIGVAVYEGKGCRFYAANAKVMKLDKSFFSSPGAIEDACRRLASANDVTRKSVQATHFHGPRHPSSEAATDQSAQIPLPEGGLPYGFPFTYH